MSLFDGEGKGTGKAPDSPDDGEYHGTLTVHVGVHGFQVTLEADDHAAIGLYKLALGIADGDSAYVASVLQVNLAGMVGP